MGRVGLGKCRKAANLLPVYFAPQYLKYAFRLLQHLVIPETKHPNSLLLQKTGTVFVVLLGCLSIVLSAINFNGQFHFRAVEIHDVLANAVLTAELFAKVLFAQDVP